jgi:hypothetical protein
MGQMRNFAVLGCLVGLLSVSLSQTPGTVQIAPAAAASHDGQNARVCGKVVEARISKYGVAGHGFPVTLDLDKPEANPVFQAVLFSSSHVSTEQIKATYEGKQVCITGKITQMRNVPRIIATDPSQFQLQTPNKN